MFDDPGNIVAIVIVVLMGLYFFYLNWKSKYFPNQEPSVFEPEPVLGPVDPTKPDYETIYNNKYPKVDILYDGRKVPWRPGRYKVDVRNFFNRYDSQVKKISRTINVIDVEENEDNNKALACLKWVLDNVRYAADKNADGTQTEYWNFAFETLLPRSFDDPNLYGDCEDQAFVLGNLMLAIGIPYWKIRASGKNVDDNIGNAGGHCSIEFFDEPQVRWVALDTTYYPNRLPICARKDYKSEPFYKETWFSWNEKYAFAADTRAVTNMQNCNV